MRKPDVREMPGAGPPVWNSLCFLPEPPIAPSSAELWIPPPHRYTHHTLHVTLGSHPRRTRVRPSGTESYSKVSAQFLVALKLVAAAQTGLPISLDSTPKDLPLPRFPGLQSDQSSLAVGPQGGLGPQGGPGPQQAPRYPVGPQGGLGPSVPWTAEWSHARLAESSAELEVGIKHGSWSPTPSPSALPHTPPHPSATSTVTMATPGAILHTPNDRQDPHSSPHYRTNLPEPSSAPRASGGQRPCSEEGDPWRISEEQREYYTNQFRGLQPDLGALILGTVAKNFFTKSKLPIPELSHIWELSDVDRDGALTFSEFCTAFQPHHRFVDQDLDSPDTPGSAEPLIVFDDVGLSGKPKDRSGLDRLKPSLLKQEMTSESADSRSRTWRRDQHSVSARPEPPAFTGPPHEEQGADPGEPDTWSYSSTSIDEAMKKAEEPPPPPPRPQKSHSRASSLDLNKLLQQGAPGVRGGWLPPPPALPPRPLASQAPLFLPPSEKTPVKKPLQTSFTRFREEEENQEVHRDGPPAGDLSTAPPQDLIGPSHLRVPQKPVRRKFQLDNPEVPPPSSAPLAPPTKPPQKLQSKQKRGIQTTIRQSKESNAVLTRLNSELQQQLKEVHQQRITLESQLDLLRPLNPGAN
ncbi:unnamed protein product [Gadus morhua 'NCC']